MHASWTRRDLLGRGATLALAAQVQLPAFLKGSLPAQVQALLPHEARGAINLVGELLKLEQEAKLKNLPKSKLSKGEGQLNIDPSRLYEQAMPRLVALIDRAEKVSPDFAEQAGGLLAKLHLTEYDPPDAWFGQTSAPAPYVEAPGGSLLHLPALPTRPLRLADAPDAPGADEGLKLPDIAATQNAVVHTRASVPAISTSLKFADLEQEYASWFSAATIRPEHRESADWHLTMMRESRDRYARVGKRLGVPWYFIAAVHGLEASFNFRAHLHNGDFPLSRRTHQVPAGRPLVWLPPSDWEDSATDALRLMGFTGQNDWGVPRLLYRLEAYNGFGYRRAGRATPYLWSFSSLYDRGKFVADGKFSPTAISQQCGAAVMLKVLAEAGELDA